MGHIYIIKNQITQDIYVGKTTKTVSERMRKHLYNAKCGHDTHLYRAFNKYGSNNFIIESIQEILDNNLLNDRECYYIECLSPKYNMTKGGDGGNTYIFLKEETRKKISERNSGKNNPMFGKRGQDNPNYGKKRGKTPKISQALKNPCICEGVYFSSITDAEKHYRGKCSVRRRLDNPNHSNWYRLIPKTKRK